MLRNHCYVADDHTIPVPCRRKSERWLSDAAALEDDSTRHNPSLTSTQSHASSVSETSQFLRWRVWVYHQYVSHPVDKHMFSPCV